VIDSPGIPEKKSFPPRALLALLLTILVTGATGTGMIFAYRWSRVDASDPRKQLAQEIEADLRELRIRMRSRRALR
jgi:hypothetical protein